MDKENVFEKADLIRMSSEDFSSQYQRAMAKIMEAISISNGGFKCTKAQRTGCSLCGFGIKFDQSRFVRMQETEPNKIKFAFKPLSEGGAGYKEVCEFVNEYCGFKIQIPNIEGGDHNG